MDRMLLDMLTCTEIFMFLVVTALLASALGRVPCIGAMLLGMVSLRTSTTVACFNSMVDPLMASPVGMSLMLVLKTSAVCCSINLQACFAQQPPGTLRSHTVSPL